MSTYIYGASDDNIEVDGDFYDEYNGSAADILIGIGDNRMQASIEFNGDWNIKVLVDGNEYDYVLYPAGTEQAVEYSGRDYTDVLVVDDPVDFVAVGLVAARK